MPFDLTTQSLLFLFPLFFLFTGSYFTNQPIFLSFSALLCPVVCECIFFFFRLLYPPPLFLRHLFLSLLVILRASFFISNTLSPLSYVITSHSLIYEIHFTRHSTRFFFSFSCLLLLFPHFSPDTHTIECFLSLCLAIKTERKENAT